MNTMIERVARAIRETPNSSDYETLVAVRAIQAMREPTEEMVEILIKKHGYLKDHSTFWADAWNDGIDAALKGIV